MNESKASPANAASPEEAIAWCAAELRRYDPDRYFTALLAGEAGRRALFSLYAFNLEIAKTRETVSEPMLGRIRLQWWREAIEGIYDGTPRDHAVVTALAETIARHPSGRDRFDRMIDGREFDLEDRQPESLGELVAYADATSGELTCVALELLGVRDAAALASGRSAGIAWALSGLLRAVPFHAAQGRCFLPDALLAAHGVAVRDILEGKPGAGLKSVVEELVRVARDHRDRARQTQAVLPQSARAGLAFLPLVAADLRQIEKRKHDVFALRPPAPLGRQLRIMRAAWFGRF